MKIEIVTTSQVEISAISVVATPRYWESASVNGVEDVNGDLIPCRDGDTWRPEINVDTGVIINWELGKTADIHYKVCDECGYILRDKSGAAVKVVDNVYVPDTLCPGGDGYGDYIMQFYDNGKIKNWSPNSSDFNDPEK